MKTENSLLRNAAHAAKRLNLSESTLAKMRLYGTGPAYVKLGRRVAYRDEDLDARIEANRFRSTAEYPNKIGEASE